jgi:hypothetical protein
VTEMMGSEFYFSFGPVVRGALIHMMVGAGYGAVFAVVVRMLEPPRVLYRILLSWKDVQHAEENRSRAPGSCGASGG